MFQMIVQRRIRDFKTFVAKLLEIIGIKNKPMEISVLFNTNLATFLRNKRQDHKPQSK